MWKQPGRYVRTHSQKHARWYTWNGRLEERERRVEKQYFRSLVDNGLDYWELGPKYLAWPRKKGKDVPKEGLVTEIMALGYGEFKSDESTDVLLHHLNRAQRGLMMYSKYSIEELYERCMIEWLEKADDEQKFEKFMELSPELREMVYKEVFADLPPVLMAPIAHPITMTSQLVRHETLPLFRAESLVAWDVWNSGTSRFRWPAGPGFDDTMLRSLVRVVVPWTNQIRAELTVELSYDRRARVLNVSKVWSLPGSRFARASQDARDAFVEALRVFHEHEWKGETQSTMSSVNFAGQLWTFGS
ncbi:hypothetical protein AMS68_002909 [Peltaster fructicola]|uniref:Uncharacterized protein n=1 Tax=Peltaster fructicola TaxID=286661 RepID=A0A6H0XRK3_9PEZI|nr:hypothetical protein AMS68_002909 [Peltaster fructicola]